MPGDLITCPVCKGHRKIPGRGGKITCPFCEGKGKVSSGQSAARERRLNPPPQPKLRRRREPRKPAK